jgi:hypothetical protein
MIPNHSPALLLQYNNTAAIKTSLLLARLLPTIKYQLLLLLVHCPCPSYLPPLTGSEIKHLA